MPSERKRRQRRVRGTGSVFWDKLRRVHVAKQIVGRTAGGKPKWLQRSGKTPVEASRRLAEAMGSPAKVTGAPTTVGAWAAKWVAADTSRPRTRAVRANSVTHHITPILGPLRLKSVTTFDVEAAVRQWGEKVGSPNTVRLILSHLYTCLEAAVRAGMIPTNPAKGARRPSEVKKKIHPFTAAELATIMDESAGRRTTRIIAPMAAIGCRIGEALALDVADFDAEAGTLSISRTQDLDRSTGPTKSSAGVRVVEVPEPALAVVRLAAAGRTEGPLFPVEHGGRGQHSHVWWYWKGLLKRVGLKYRNIHQLRHSVATLAISNGVPLGDVAEMLGDRVETVVSTYLHRTGVRPAVILGKLYAESRAVPKDR